MRGSRNGGSLRHLARRARRARLVALALCTAVPLAANATADERNGELWQARATGFDSGRLDPRPTEELIQRLEAEVTADGKRLEPRFELLEALYFDGDFLTSDARLQREAFERMVALAEDTLLLAREAAGCPPPLPPGVADGTCAAGSEALVRAHFWSAISWGLWGMSHSRLSAASHDVAGTIRDHAQRVIELDPEFADGGGYRLLGRLHTATPRIVFFTGWIDRATGLTLLERANHISTADPRNPLFLAEALLRYRPDERRRALALLQEVASRTPHPDRLVEESETIARARSLLAEETVR